MDKENEGDLNSDIGNSESSSGSRSSSPIDDLVRDPSCIYRVPVEPRTVSTRRHIVLDNNKSDQNLKSKAFDKESTMVTPPEKYDGKYSFQVDASHLTSALTGAVGGYKPPNKDIMADDKEPDELFKEAFFDMAQSIKAIGQTAKQNNTQFLADIPYFGVPPSTYKNKSIIPISEPNRFLDLVDTITSTADFTEAGKVQVLKSKLLGPALEHWSTYTGGGNWNNAKTHLLRLYPETQSYTSVMNKVPKLKREKNEQICEYATRVNQLFNRLQSLHPTGNYPDAVKQSDSVRKLLEVLPQAVFLLNLIV